MGIHQLIIEHYFLEIYQMKKLHKPFHILMVLVLVAGLLAPIATFANATSVRIHPLLAQIAKDTPDEVVRVMVQKADDSKHAERLVEKLGGLVTKDLYMINGFAAQIPAKAALKITKLASVNWVSLDAPMVPAGTTETVRDEFNAISFSNNDGSVNWEGTWVEDDAAGAGPTTGNVDIYNGGLRIDDQPNTGTFPSAAREVDLSAGVTWATFSFDFLAGPGVDSAQDKVAIEVSADGGNSYTTLEIMEELNGNASGSRSYDISTYISADTKIRFRVYDYYGGSDEYFLADNVQIEYGEASPSVPVATSVEDLFNTVSYDNNDGSLPWAGDWIEDDVAGAGPSLGNVDIYDGQLRLNDQPNTDTAPSAAREVDLTGATSASFNFDFNTTAGVDTSDRIAIEVSSDSGVNYTALELIDNIVGVSSGARSYDITPYISADTVIRFRVDNLYGGSDEYFSVDNVQIDIGLAQNYYLDTLGVDQLHAEGLTGQGVTVAVIDSGIGNHPDFAGRLLSTDYGISDLYGHGTHVAGIIGGDGSASAGTYTGVAPGVTLVPLGVSDEFGMAYESDVVNALQWVHDHKDSYNIRVVNLSLNSTVEDSYNNSGIDAAVEILWLNGIVVVASSGNSNPDAGYNTAKTAPANDPFIIVVGASDEYATVSRTDDAIASFSAYGITQDGFLRPDIIAPGYNLYSPLSPDSTWGASYPERLGFNSQYIRLSGTSMAAPTVTGAVALLLQDEPNLTPDQVKYRLIHSASTLTDANGRAFSYLDAYAAVHGTTTEAYSLGAIPHELLAKMAMIAYWASVNGGGTIDWENINWDAVNWNAVNWNAVNWNAVNWNAVNWNAVNWNAVNWNAVNWNAVNWNAVNWNAVSWNAVNWNAVYMGGHSLTEKSNEIGGLFWGDDAKETPPPANCFSQDTGKGEASESDCSITDEEIQETPSPSRDLAEKEARNNK
jgi:serine protease AprX